MRSKDLAQLAGVSVRTLRHYHSIGIMPEPVRSPNGYRDYSALDLARLLRIKHLASLGFSLAQIGDMLDRMDAGPIRVNPALPAFDSFVDEALSELDGELALQIEELQEQRRIVAQLRTERLVPDMPVRFARILQALSDYKNLDELGAEDRVVLLLVGHLYNETELAELENVAKALQDDSIAHNVEVIRDRCASLEADTPAEVRDQLVEDTLVLLEPLMEQLDAANWAGEKTMRDHLLKAVMNRNLNQAQLDVLGRIEQGIEAKLTERA